MFGTWEQYKPYNSVKWSYKGVMDCGLVLISNTKDEGFVDSCHMFWKIIQYDGKITRYTCGYYNYSTLC